MGILCAVVFYFFLFFFFFFGFSGFFFLSSFLTCFEVNNHSHRERKDLLEKA
jgi:hypothetical protein